MDDTTKSHLKESPLVVTLPLIALAIPSIFIGYFIGPSIMSGEFFDGAIKVLANHDTVAPLVEEYEHPFSFAVHALLTLPFGLAMLGVATAYVFVVLRPEWSTKTKKLLGPLNHVLENNYYFDKIYINYFAAGGVGLGRKFWLWIDVAIIDGLMVNGTAKTVAGISARLRKIQTGYLYHYVFAMVFGLLIMLGWLYWRALNG